MTCREIESIFTLPTVTASLCRMPESVCFYTLKDWQTLAQALEPLRIRGLFSCPVRTQGLNDSIVILSGVFLRFAGGKLDCSSPHLVGNQQPKDVYEPGRHRTLPLLILRRNRSRLADRFLRHQIRFHRTLAYPQAITVHHSVSST